jgi:uncharacterized repeat protein (TIGR03803 family)
VGSLIQGNDSLLYGMTTGGGANNKGVIFQYNAATGTCRDIHDFGSDSDGFFPDGSLLQANNGLLYGLTSYGGTMPSGDNSGGTIFSINISNDSEKVVHNFGNTDDGSEPGGSLIQASNGILYGMTPEGGNSIYAGGSHQGMIFSFNPYTGAYENLHNFGIMNDGSEPFGDLLEIIDTLTSVSQIPSSFTQLQISPNPSTGQFMIQLPGNQDNYPTEVYNMLGQKIEQLTLGNTQSTLNLSNQAAGMYFVYVQTENGTATGKVVLTK